MMREIKSRGKRKDTGQWISGGYVKYTDYKCYEHNLIFASNGNPNDIYPETVGQFTGLYDKNGKEIYEGDVLSGKFLVTGDRKAMVIFFDRAASFMIRYENRSTPTAIFNCSWFEDINDVKCEVIGNIHDNPELLTR